MILEYNRKPDATVDEKIQSLMESTQLALNDISRAQQTADVAKEDAQTSVTLAQTARQAAAEASDAADKAKKAADEAAEAVEQIEDDVSGLASRVTQAEADIDTAEGAIASLGTRVTEAEGDITTIEGSVSSLSGRVTDAEADIAAAEGNISTLQSAVSTAQGDINTIQGNITNLSGRVSDAESDITAVEGNITTLTDRVEEAEDNVDDVMRGLALAEDIIGTVNWIANHGIYVASTDTSVVPGKVYYTLTGVAIASPTGNPSRNGYYELVSGKYVLSTDTTVDSLKTYYQVTAAQVAEPSGNPSTIPYYELQIDEAITQYINTHLTLTERGLSVTDGSSSSLLISSDGVTIYSNGHMVGQYGEGAIIGDENGYHIEITGDKLSFVNGKGTAATEIAYMQYNELYIPRVVVVDSMQIGHWIWDAISADSHLTLKWKGVS